MWTSTEIAITDSLVKQFMVTEGYIITYHHPLVYYHVLFQFWQEFRQLYQEDAVKLSSRHVLLCLRNYR